MINGFRWQKKGEKSDGIYETLNQSTQDRISLFCTLTIGLLNYAVCEMNCIYRYLYIFMAFS